MPPKPKKQKAADPRNEVVGRWLGVPTDFFNVHTDGKRYLARVKEVHATKKDMVTRTAATSTATTASTTAGRSGTMHQLQSAKA
mmetsp:Transcript_49898/g.129970  ORF Transcript_49898/g.129970 Transcript_49898/m.129970 type:complete len:84 (+) Transcript_49898:86-337(+)